MQPGEQDLFKKMHDAILRVLLKLYIGLKFV